MSAGGRAAARVAVAAAALGLVAGGLYGIAAPLTWGHHGYHGGEYVIRARHTLRHGALLPGNDPGWRPPAPSRAYLHHPILTHQLVTATVAVLGDHEYAVRGAGLLAALAALLLLAALVWRHWGPWPAALAAWVFVLVPLDVWFAAHIDPGFPSIAALLAFFWFYLAWLDEGRWRHALLACACAALAGGFEWSPYLAAAPVGLHALGRGLRRRGRSLAFVPLYALAVASPFALHLLLVRGAGQWADLMTSYAIRTYVPGPFWPRLVELGGALVGAPLALVLAAWSVIAAGRIVRGRAAARDLVGVAFVVALAAYVLIFRGAVIIHGYRLLYAGVAGAIAAADLALALGAAGARLSRRPAARPLTAAAVGLALLAAMAPAAAAALAESRRRGGIPLWPAYDPELDRLAFAAVARAATRPGDVIAVHPTFHGRMELAATLDRDLRPVASLRDVRAPAAGGDAGVLLELPALAAPEWAALAALAQRHAVVVVGRFAVVDLRRPGPYVHAEQLVAPPPRGRLHRYLVGPYAPLARREDPAREVALLVALDVAPPAYHAPAPTLPAAGDPAALIEHHNYQVLLGEADRAAAARERLRAGLALPGPRPLPGGGVALGVARRGGGRALLFQAGPRRPGTLTLRATARGPDGAARAAAPVALRPGPAAWREGFIYEQPIPLGLGGGRQEVEVRVGAGGAKAVVASGAVP